MNTGEKIKKLRKEKGLTQLQLAEKCGMYDSGIRRIENSGKTPTVTTLQKIADALEVSYIDLLADTPGREAILNRLREKGLTEAQIAKEFNLPVPENTSLNTSPEIAFRIRSALDHLNDEGQERVADYAEDLLLIPKYQK